MNIRILYYFGLICQLVELRKTDFALLEEEKLLDEMDKVWHQLDLKEIAFIENTVKLLKIFDPQ